MSDYLVLGLDIGATTTRVLLATDTGVRVRTGRGTGGNPNAHPAAQAAAVLLAALREALADADPALVRAGTMGLAGMHRLVTDPGAKAAFDAAWHEAGLRCPYLTVSDGLVAYAAGTAAPDGTVLLSGTGAVAAAVSDHELSRVADGHGWLLGDAGSGFWLGREAVRAALSDLDRLRAPGLLSTLVLTEVLGSGEVAPRPRKTAADLVQTLNARPPIGLAALAPLVMRASASGDPAALEVVGRAADCLLSTVAMVKQDAGTPIVLAGGMLTGDTPLATEVRARLVDRWPHATVSTAGDGAAAAAWLAARTLPGVDPAGLHARLVG